MQNSYIKNEDFEVVLNDYLLQVNAKKKLTVENIDVLNSIDRITSNAVFAIKSSPSFNCSAMDGIAVLSSKTHLASEINPLELQEGVDFEYINTGNPLKSCYDSVIMIEDCITSGNGKIKIISPSHPWQHVRPVGEDISCGEMILKSQHQIRPLDIGALISGGIETLTVYKKPKIGIIPTGSELVEDAASLSFGKIIESNSRVFQGLIEKQGAIANRYKICHDNFDELKEAVSIASLENDILLINAGSSAGTKDFTLRVIESLGKVHTHGLSIKPGKPTILGFVNDTPVIGIPGYPASSFIVFDMIANPIIIMLSGKNNEKVTQKIEGTLTKRVVSSLKNTSFVRVSLGKVDDKLVVSPLSQNAGATMSLVKADGLLTIDRKLEGIDAGKKVLVDVYKPLDEIYKKLVSIGSHDVLMDILSDMINVSSTHLGSMGGVFSLSRGECIIAPIHLLDESTGRYNDWVAEKFFPNKKMILIKGVKREQGLIVQKNNPKNINTFKDLTKSDIRFVNRQKGAGTRLLLDYNLKQFSIDANKINGYDREVTTHMALATMVKSDSVDVGLGIKSCATLSDLSFISVGYEDYDFLTTYDFYQKGYLNVLIETLKNNNFQSRVNEIGGYKFANSGNVIELF